MAETFNAFAATYPRTVAAAFTVLVFLLTVLVHYL